MNARIILDAETVTDVELGRLLHEAAQRQAHENARRKAHIDAVNDAPRQFDDAIGTAIVRPEEKTYPASWLVFFFFMAMSLGIGLGIATVIFSGVI